MNRILAAVIVALLATGSVRAGKVETDFNPRADFSAYKTWDWVPDRGVGHRGILAGEPAREIVETAVSRQLARVGLRRVGTGETPDLVVRYWGEIAEGEEGTSTGGVFGYDPFTDGYWNGAFKTAVHFSEKAATLMVDLIDPTTKMLTWRAFIEQKYGSPTGVGNPVAEALVKAFDRYPPSESARAKKLKEWEKRDAAK